MVFTHQNPSCTKPQLSHLIQLQGSLVLPPRPAGSFLLPSRAGPAQPCQGQAESPGSLPCVSHVSPAALGLLFPSPQTLPTTQICPQGGSNSPEGLQAGTSLPAEGQRGTKPRGHRVASSQGACSALTCSKPHFHQGSGPRSPGQPGLEDVQHTLALSHVGFLLLSTSSEIFIHKAANKQHSSSKN